MKTRPSSLGTLLALPSSLPKGGKDLGVEMLITFTCCCSTATQTIQFLNDLYNKFDKAIDNYDVYKVISNRKLPQLVSFNGTKEHYVVNY